MRQQATGSGTGLNVSSAVDSHSQLNSQSYQSDSNLMYQQDVIVAYDLSMPIHATPETQQIRGSAGTSIAVLIVYRAGTGVR